MWVSVRTLELPCGCWELNSGPLEEHCVFLTIEPSPACLFVFLETDPFYIAQADLELMFFCASASQVQKLQAYTSMPGLKTALHYSNQVYEVSCWCGTRRVTATPVGIIYFPVYSYFSYFHFL